MPFGISTHAGPRKHVLDEGAHWHNLCGGDAAFLSNYFDQVLFLNMKRNLEKIHVRPIHADTESDICFHRGYAGLVK